MDTDPVVSSVGEFTLPMDDYEQLIVEHRQDDQSSPAGSVSPTMTPTKRKSSKKESSPTSSITGSNASTPEPEEGKALYNVLWHDIKLEKLMPLIQGKKHGGHELNGQIIHQNPRLKARLVGDRREVQLLQEEEERPRRNEVQIYIFVQKYTLQININHSTLPHGCFMWPSSN
jgi:hypothetical protein